MPRPNRTTKPKTVIDRHELAKVTALMLGMEKLADDQYVQLEGQIKVYVEDDVSGERTDLVGRISFAGGDGYNIPKFVTS